MKNIFAKYNLFKNTKYLLSQVAKFGRNSLFVRNLGIIACLLLILLIINGINFYQTIQSNINEELENNNIYLLERIEDMGTNVLKTAETIAANVAVQSFTKQYAVTQDKEGEKNYESEISDFIKTYTLVYDYLDSVYVISTVHNRATEGKGTISTDLFADAAFLEKEGDIVDVIVVPRKKKDIFPDLITIVRPITINGSLENLDGANSVTGLVCVNIRTKSLGKLLNRVEPENDTGAGVIILNEKNTVLYSADSHQVGMNAKDVDILRKLSSASERQTYQTKTRDGRVIVSASPSDYKGYTFISVVPTANSWEIFLQTLRYICIGMLLVLLVSIIAAAIIAYVSYQPIIDISQLFNSDDGIEADNALALREKSGEMKFITENILKNLQKNQEMEHELESRVVLLRRAMFTALQVQINPHFIYNTLENINWLAVKLSGSENKVSSSILALAKLMRYSLETEGYLVSLEDEVRHAQLYIELLTVRYPNLFEVEWRLDPGIMSARIIRLTLQPLLENAVQHGIRPKRSRGHIVISGCKSNDKIYINITDDGVGMSTADIQSLNKQLSDDYLLESRHVGMRNVNQRLKIIFGEGYGTRIIESQEEYGGFTVQISIPAEDFGNDAFSNNGIL